MKPVERSEPESREIQVARAVRREAREQLGLAGGVVFIAGMAATAAGVAVALPIAVVVLAGLGGAYAFPTSERGRWAKAILAARDAFRPPGASIDDPRRVAAEGMAVRIQEYVGAPAPSAAAAWAMVSLVEDSLADLSAVALLRSAAGSNPGRRSLYEQKAESLKGRIEARVDHAIAVIAEMYEAVLAEDDIALREIVAKAEAEVRRIEAEGEVSSLLDPRPGSRRD
jgi:hypothetical protein